MRMFRYIGFTNVLYVLSMPALASGFCQVSPTINLQRTLEYRYLISLRRDVKWSGPEDYLEKVLDILDGWLLRDREELSILEFSISLLLLVLLIRAYFLYTFIISWFRVAMETKVSPKENASAACLLTHLGQLGQSAYLVLQRKPTISGLIYAWVSPLIWYSLKWSSRVGIEREQLLTINLYSPLRLMSTLQGCRLPMQWWLPCQYISLAHFETSKMKYQIYSSVKQRFSRPRTLISYFSVFSKTPSQCPMKMPVQLHAPFCYMRQSLHRKRAGEVYACDTNLRFSTQRSSCFVLERRGYRMSIESPDEEY